MSAIPKFPAIAISRGDSFLVIEEPIRQCSYAGWRNGYFDDLVYFDSEGRLWPVEASLSEPLRFFDRFRTNIPVDVRYGEPREDAQAEAVTLIERLVEEDRSDLYDQFVSHSELKSLFRSARTATELISVVRNLGAGADDDSDAETSYGI